jgi:prophage maintenance system killer protein
MHPISRILCGVYDSLRDAGEVQFPLHQSHKDALDTVVKTVEAAYFGPARFATPQDQAAAYFYHLIKKHPVPDGNKRLAVLWVQIFCNALDVAIRPEASLDVLAVAVSRSRGDRYPDHVLIPVIKELLFGDSARPHGA